MPPDIVLTTKAKATIDITSGKDQWSGILPEYSHYSNSVEKRNYKGYGTTRYKTTEETELRNDIINSKVAYDDEFVYIMAETVNPITSYKDSKWMRIFIDTDPSSTKDSWEGFEYVINRKAEDRTESTTLLEKSTGGWNVDSGGKVDYSVKDNIIQIKIPRS